VGYELNPFINAVAPYTGFDAAVFITAALSIALMWALAKTRLCLAAAIAKTLMATKALPPANNLALALTGLALVDYLAAALGTGPHAAGLLLGLAGIFPTLAYHLYREVK